MESLQEIAQQISSSGLKVTPQRIAIMQALEKSRIHPTAEELYKEISPTIPGLSVTTIYNTLDSFVEKGLVCRVKTDSGSMRYDRVSEHHHHLYCASSDRLEDYYDDELDKMLKAYFEKKQIEGFRISDVRLQLTGEFQDQELKKNNKQ